MLSNCGILLWASTWSTSIKRRVSCPFTTHWRATRRLSCVFDFHLEGTTLHHPAWTKLSGSGRWAFMKGGWRGQEHLWFNSLCWVGESKFMYPYKTLNFSSVENWVLGKAMFCRSLKLVEIMGLVQLIYNKVTCKTICSCTYVYTDFVC